MFKSIMQTQIKGAGVSNRNFYKSRLEFLSSYYLNLNDRGEKMICSETTVTVLLKLLEFETCENAICLYLRDVLEKKVSRCPIKPCNMCNFNIMALVRHALKNCHIFCEDCTHLRLIRMNVQNFFANGYMDSVVCDGFTPQWADEEHAQCFD